MFDFVSCFQQEIAYVEIILMCYKVQYDMSALSARLSQCIASDLLVFCVWGIVVQVVVLCVRNK